MPSTPSPDADYTRNQPIHAGSAAARCQGRVRNMKTYEIAEPNGLKPQAGRAGYQTPAPAKG